MDGGRGWTSSGMRAQDRRSQGLAAAVDLPARERGSIDAEAFLTVEDVRENGTPGVYGGLQSVFRLCEGSAKPT